VHPEPKIRSPRNKITTPSGLVDGGIAPDSGGSPSLAQRAFAIEPDWLVSEVFLSMLVRLTENTGGF
jgi:hypothetical protein